VRFGGEQASEGPAGGQGAVEAFDLAVGLGSIGPCAFGSDTELEAGCCPAAAAVAGTVVRQHSFDAHAAGGEPVDRMTQDGDGGGRGLVVVDLGVGQPGVVIQDGVDVGGADQRAVILVPAGADRSGPVAFALGSAQVAPTPTVGDVAELLHIDVDQRPGMVVFVTAHRLASDPIDVGKPVDSASDQHRVHRRCRHPQLGGDRDRTQPPTPPQVHDRPDHRSLRPSW